MIRPRFKRLDRCELLVGDTEHLNVRLRDYVRNADVLIGIESDHDEAQIRITSGATVGEDIEDFRTAFFGTGFQDFEAGDFLVEESKREIALRAASNLDWRALATIRSLPQ